MSGVRCQVLDVCLGLGVAGCRLSVVGCRLSVVGCWILGVGCWMLGAGPLIYF